MDESTMDTSDLDAALDAAYNAAAEPVPPDTSEVEFAVRTMIETSQEEITAKDETPSVVNFVHKEKPRPTPPPPTERYSTTTPLESPPYEGPVTLTVPTRPAQATQELTPDEKFYAQTMHRLRVIWRPRTWTLFLGPGGVPRWDQFQQGEFQDTWNRADALTRERWVFNAARTILSKGRSAVAPERIAALMCWISLSHTLIEKYR